MRYALTIALLIITLALQWHPVAQQSALAFWGLAVAYGFLQVEVAVSFVHDGSHGSVGHSPLVWTSLAALHDFINGTSSVLWCASRPMWWGTRVGADAVSVRRIYQHVLSHHVRLLKYPSKRKQELTRSAVLHQCRGDGL